MGRDKALLELDGVAFAVVVAGVLAAAGATRVIAVGGDEPALRRLGLEVVPDPRQGDGPLAGIAAALHVAGGSDAVVVLACDLIAASSDGVRMVLDALEHAADADVAVPVIDGRREPLHAAWRPAAGPAIDAALAAGERAVHAVFNRLRTLDVPGLDPAWLRNVNSPGQLGHTWGMSDAPVPEIDVDELAKRLGDGSFVLDVRQPEEYVEAHVPGAVLIPLNELGARQDEVPSDRPVLVICATGPRSARAVDALRAAGYDAANVVGGTNAWIEAGFPVAEGSN